MALVSALLRSPVRDLTIVSCGGPDVGMLCAAGKVRRVVAPFVTLDTIPLEPHFRRVRQGGEIAFTEYDEGMFMFGLLAAAHRLPFLPTRAGLGSDVLRVNPELRTVRSPYGDGEELVAVPALTMDVAFVHLNRADARGNAQYLGPDPYFDDLYAKAAARCYVSCERLVDPADLLKEGPVQSLLISRSMVAGVVEAPGGAGFTSCEPDYGCDEAEQRVYAETSWEDYRERLG
jgi:glutaconate CoA-transferase subunit A